RAPVEAHQAQRAGEEPRARSRHAGGQRHRAARDQAHPGDPPGKGEGDRQGDQREEIQEGPGVDSGRRSARPVAVQGRAAGGDDVPALAGLGHRAQVRELPRMKLGIVSLGCDKATVDSERLVGDLVGHGAVVTSDLPHADVILVNTCGFIDAAKQESIDAILSATSLKAQGDVKAVVAVGCLVERYKQELQTEIPEVDLFLGCSDLHHLVPALAERGLIDDPVAAHPGVRQFLGDQAHVRYLKISEGCDHTCAFCAIPLMRGKHRSEPLERLVREAQLLEAQGAKEINLVAQDLGHYGRDAGRGAPTLPDLLDALLAGTGVPWYRLLYVYSAGLTDRLGGFAYSPQDGTRATAYPDDVPDGVKRDRLEELLEVQRAISAERLGRFVGRDVSVLVDRVADPDDDAGSTHVGRVPWQADDVDGVTYLAQGGWARPGSFLAARLIASEDYDFKAVALT